MPDDLNLYAAFDNFLAVETWHTTHPLDARRFYLALAEVVQDKSFNADSMAEYFFEKTGVRRDTEEGLAQSIRRYASNAWAVKEYLEADGLLRLHQAP